MNEVLLEADRLEQQGNPLGTVLRMRRPGCTDNCWQYEDGDGYGCGTGSGERGDGSGTSIWNGQNGSRIQGALDMFMAPDGWGYVI